MHLSLYTVYLCVVFGLTSNVYGAVYQRPDYEYAMQQPVDKNCDDADQEKTCSLKFGHDGFSYLEMILDQGWISRSCPEGTAFSIEDCGCSILLPQVAAQHSSSSSEEDEKCEKVEPVPCTRKASEDIKTYLQFVEGKGWIEQSCAKGTAYSDKDCACTIFLPQSDISEISSEEDCETDKPVPCTRKPSDESGAYLEFIDGKGWVKRPCAKGTGYSPADCACTVSMPYEDSSSSSSEEECEIAEPAPCTRKPGNDMKCYLQFVEGKGWVEQFCAKGTAYNDKDCACTISLPKEDVSSSSEESCEKPEDAPCTRKRSQDYDHYLQYVEGKGWIEQSCPKGTLYNDQDCACTILLPQDDMSSSSEQKENCEPLEPAPCTRKPDSDRKFYLQFIEGKGFVRQACAKGTAYNNEDCSCSIILPREDISSSSSSSSSSSEETYEDAAQRPCRLESGDDQTSFRQYEEGYGWTVKSCPDGTAFSSEDCGCTVILPVKQKPITKVSYGHY